MENPSNPEQFGPGLSRQAYLEQLGPGLSRQAYLEQLADTGHTGWHDERGVPAPWPEDFCDPDSGWQPTTGGDTTNTDPNQPF